MIHFNFGLHDLVDAYPGEGKEHVDLTAYGENLVTIYTRLAARAKKVICRHDAVPKRYDVDGPLRREGRRVQRQGAGVLQPLAASGDALLVDDLHAAVDAYCGTDYKTCELQKPKNVHFSPSAAVSRDEGGRLHRCRIGHVTLCTSRTYVSL